MKDIWKIIAEIAVQLHPERVGFVASRIAQLPDHSALTKTHFGSGVDESLMESLAKAWAGETDLSPDTLAAALKAASATADLAEKQEVVNLVWTGPSTGMVASRHTEQSLIEVISSARRKLFLVSFVAYNIESVSGSLRAAVERNVQVDVLFESAKEHGGKVDHDSVSGLRELIPSVNIYTWSGDWKSGSSSTYTGAVHAKCAVADGAIAFITSANLTSAAMERNMELGVLVNGGTLPAALHRHLDSLVNTKVIEPV
jgi:phosphatidylserine/phosphatidylglycerophosphate/cardiolipin synthase-like enzyme